MYVQSSVYSASWLVVATGEDSMLLVVVVVDAWIPASMSVSSVCTLINFDCARHLRLVVCSRLKASFFFFLFSSSGGWGKMKAWYFTAEL